MLALSVKLRKMFMDEMFRSKEESAKREQVLKDEAAAKEQELRAGVAA